jgi:hypothetical protein
MYDALHADEAEFTMAEQVRRPSLIPAPKTGAFSGFGDALKAVIPSAVLESTRALSPLLDAYGKSAAFAQGGGKEETINRIGQNDLSPLIASELRKISPDPHTAGVASQIVFGAGKLVGKAVGYSLMAGPVAGAGLTGVDEGINRGMELTDKGVDTGTAIKAGAVHGVLTAANVALPIAGKTLAQTAGLALAGGPLSFMAENAAINSILDTAGFSQVAKEYDPFDPVGLTVATLAPMMFGAAAHAMRAKAAAKVGAGATPVDTPAPAFRPDEEAAARTLQMTHHAESVSLAPRDDFAARNAHADALDAAGQAIDAGRAVSLDTLPLDPARAAEAAARMRDALPAIEARGELHPAAEAITAETDLPQVAGKPAPAEAVDGIVPADVQMAHRITLDNPDLPVFTGAKDAQGQPMSTRAADLLADAEMDVREANRLSVAFDAAVTCFLRNPA